MKVHALPIDSASILALTWSDYEPHYAELQSRPLSNENIETWLNDWSTLAATADEHYWRLYIATTVNTADQAIEEQFNRYIEEIQPAVKTAEQMLKDKLLASGLSPKRFETALRRMRAEAEIFTEKKRTVMLGIVSVGVPVGFFVAGAINNLLQDWRQAFLVGVVPVLLSVVSIFVLPESDKWKANKYVASKNKNFSKRTFCSCLQERSIARFINIRHNAYWLMGNFFMDTYVGTKYFNKY